jgi:peroxiredoxin Q/BCP
MTEVLLGLKAPDFTLVASGDKEISLQDYLGKKLVIYFYPADLTPSCTQEACDFRDFSAQYTEHHTEVIGISPDPLKKHDKFIVKHELPFPLLSDPEHEVAEQFGVWALKKMYGKTYMGIVRSTFLIDESGVIVKEWRKVKVKNHVQEVLNAIKELG